MENSAYHRPGNQEGFPSVRLVIMLYSFAALVALACSFIPSLDQAHKKNCLLLSCLLASVAFGIGMINLDENKSSEDSFD